MKSHQKYCGTTASQTRRGITLLEVMIVLVIIALIVSLSMPAIQSAREAARRSHCESHQRQLMLGVQAFENAFKHYPSNGWGFRWFAEPDKGVGIEQPGSWMFRILGFIEQTSLARSEVDGPNSPLLITPVSLFHCPSRREARVYPYSLEEFRLWNIENPTRATKTDYAINGGDEHFGDYEGPSGDSQLAVDSYPWVPADMVKGISYIRSKVTVAAVTDGLSHTLLMAEKSLAIPIYRDGTSLGDDQSPFVGDDIDNRRWTKYPPMLDRKYDDPARFGGPHVAGLQAVFCDGSTQTISYNIDAEVWRGLGNRSDESVYHRE